MQFSRATAYIGVPGKKNARVHFAATVASKIARFKSGCLQRVEYTAREGVQNTRHWSGRSHASEVTTLWRYTNLFIIIIIIMAQTTCFRARGAFCRLEWRVTPFGGICSKHPQNGCEQAIPSRNAKI